MRTAERQEPTYHHGPSETSPSDWDLTDAELAEMSRAGEANTEQIVRLSRGSRGKVRGKVAAQRWTPEEDYVIRMHAGIMDRDIAVLLPGRTAGAVGTRRRRLGLPVDA